MKDQDIDVGSIVKLKSDGPRMTVEKIDNTWRIYTPIQCVWFDGGRLRRGEFSPETLIVIPF